METKQIELEFYEGVSVIDILAGVATMAPAQRPKDRCELTLRESLSLRGLRLGMSPQEAAAALGKKLVQMSTRRAAKEFEVRMYETAFIFEKKDLSLDRTRRAQFRDVDLISGGFYKDRLVFIYIWYEAPGYKAPGDLERIYEDVSEALDLPVNAWNTDLGPVLLCKGFAMDLSRDPGPPIVSIYLRELEWGDRRAEELEQERKERERKEEIRNRIRP